MDKSDYLKVVKDDRTARARSSSDNEIKRISAILGDQLVHDPHWARFQQEAARQIDRAQAAIQSYQMILLDAGTTSPEALTRAKIGFHAHQAMVDSFKMMLEFPTKFKVDEED